MSLLCHSKSSADNKPYRYIIYGQSNAYGPNPNTTNFPQAVDTTIDARVKIWANAKHGGLNAFGNLDGKGEWESWDISASPRQYGSYSETNQRSNNALYSLAKKVASETGNEVECIVCAFAGSPISNLVDINGFGFSLLSDILSNVEWDYVDGIIFIQGESDQNTPLADYENLFITMRGNMSNLNPINDNTPMYVVQLQEVGAGGVSGDFAMNEFLETTPNRIDYPFYYIKTDGLEARDRLHFSNNGLNELGGVRLWNEISNNNIFLDRNLTQVKTDNGNAVVFFGGDSLEYSDDLVSWFTISGATSPYTEPLVQRRFYRSTN